MRKAAALMPAVDRRDFIFGLTGAAASAWMAAQLPALRATAAYAASAAPQAPWEFFTPEEAREFDAISAQIVPTDDTPGAREAHVVRFVDRWFATVQTDAQPVFRNDFKLLAEAVAARTPGNRSFAALGDADQVALLMAFEKSNPVSFGHFRGSTMQGMFSDPIHGGNFNKIGWTLNGYEDRYSWVPPFGYYDRV
jgi:gluconate 2-dehydrogenase gamma chain